MDRFEINILGCGSASPSLLHHPSSQVVNHRERIFMIDCGEGSQLQAFKMHLPLSRLTDIFISHMHGDHCLGLPGLLSTLALHDRGPASPVNVYLPKMGVDIVDRMVRFFCGGASYPVNLVPIEPGGGVLLETKSLTVSAFPLYHRIPAFGFLMREKPKPRKLNAQVCDFFNVPLCQRGAIKDGADFITGDGLIIPNSRFTTDAPPSLSYAYCSDTMADDRVARAVEGVDLLYHEATYLDELRGQAVERGHSTALQAAEIARKVDVGMLVIGHYSKRYVDPEPLLAEARSVFPATVAAHEFDRFTVSARGKD
ncbi:MAG: ribonuclease Z [Paramuribaculum sp.]|nr:ribonuclease Z [Paramuribaculum sp.]